MNILPVTVWHERDVRICLRPLFFDPQYHLINLRQIRLILLGIPPLGMYNQNTVVDGVSVKNASEG